MLLRILNPLIWVCFGLMALGYIWYEAWSWNSAAKVVDSGFRRLGTVSERERPGGIFLEPDSYYWLGYAKRIGEGESLRVRYTFADNAPFGREVHWSQSVSWLLVAFGKVRQAFTGEEWPVALEQSSVWLNPFLSSVMIVGVGTALFFRLGPIPAGLFMVYLVTLGDVAWTFQALRPDHQTLHALFGVFSLIGIVLGGAGWVRSGGGERIERTSLARSLEVPDFGGAKRWFFVSAVSTALGLWVSAVVAGMIVIVLFASGLFLIVFAPNISDESGVRVQPELWRWWGWIAGAGSLLFYLIEYFPNHLVFRLEVNGPLYSIAVAAMGEAMCQFLRARYAVASNRARPLMLGMMCIALVALLPLAIFFGPQNWYALKDPQMLRMHGFIEEFYSLPRYAKSKVVSTLLANFGILPIFLVLAIGLAAFARLRLHEWAVVWFSFAVTFGMLVLTYLQVRWIGLYGVMNAWLAVVAGVCAWRLLRDQLPRPLKWVVGSVLVTLLLFQPIKFGTRQYRHFTDLRQQRIVSQELTDFVLNKRLALAFRAEEGSGARVMTDPSITPALHYFAGAAGVPSFYWENIGGLHAATAFFADVNGESAKTVAHARGLTHVMVMTGDRLQNFIQYVATGRVDKEAAQKLFAAQLMKGDFALPEWLHSTIALQQIGQQVYTYRGLSVEESWRVYRIVNE
jgi:hypothetical protein